MPDARSTITSALRTAWERGEFPDLSASLAETTSPRQAADLVISEQFYRWNRGDRARLEGYLRRYPSLKADPTALLEMVRAEVVLRRARAEYPLASDYASLFPELTPELSELFTGQHSDARLDETALISQEDLWRPPAKNVASDAPHITGYELQEELGRGGMGVVFRATQILAGREVALKIIRPDSLALVDPTTRANVIARFRTEARAAAKLNHDNIVTVFDIGECRGFHFYTMKLVDGPSLSNLLREKPLDERLAARYCMEASRGVEAAHQLGILHRDLKPSNVMLDRAANRALVADFGLAKVASDTLENLTHSGDVVGTPAYMPPEQASDSSKVTAQSDIYSLGATLYHAITGRPPFQAASLGEILRQIHQEEPIAPRRINSRINRDLETICLKALQKSPSQRYASAKDFADDLQRYLEGHPIIARPVSRVEAAWRWCKRNPRLASAVGSAASLALIALLAIVIGYVQTSLALASSKRRLEKSLSLVDELFTKVSEDDLFYEPGMQAVRQQILERARSHYNDLLQDSADLPIAQEELAAAHYRFGRISLELGDTDIARRELADAERMQRAQWEASPATDDRALSLANTLIESAKLRQAEDQYEKMVALYQEALDLRSKAAQSQSSNLELKRLVASARMNVGIVLRDNRMLQEAQAAIEEAQRERQAILDIDPEHHRTQRDLAFGAFNLALLFKQAADDQPGANHAQKATLTQNALREFDVAQANFAQLIELQPRHQSHQLSLAKTLRMRASIEQTPDHSYELAVKLTRALVKENPDVVEYRIEAGQLEMERGYYFSSCSKAVEAIDSLGDAATLLRPIAKRKAAAAEFLATCLVKRGEVELSAGQHSQAIADLQESLNWWTALIEQTKNDPFLLEKQSEAAALLKSANANPVAGPPTAP